MLRRITVTLTVAEREGLDQLMKLDLRAPDDQLRWLLREELLRRGLPSTIGPGSQGQEGPKQP